MTRWLAPDTRRWLAAALLVFAGAATEAGPVPAWSLLPLPATVQPAASGAVTIGDGATLVVNAAGDHDVDAIADQLTQRLADTRGLHLHRGKDDGHPAVTLALDPTAAANDAGYHIAVDGTGIHVTARTARGLFYGSITAWQLLTPHAAARGTPVNVAYGTIDDQPRFNWRGILLDSGRHFQSVADIKSLIDAMALHKLNVLVWHLTEDQGWRLAIPGYPLLTSVAACRKADGLDAELSGSPDKPYCGFYTEAEARDVVRYAAARYVDVVPEFDLPGHSQAAIAAYPWLGVTGKRPDVWTQWGVSPWLLNPNDKTLAFVDDVLDVMMRIFSSRYISIGGDEADKAQWKASPALQAQARSLGLANMDALQGWFMARVASHLVEHGRVPVGWDDQIADGATLPASQVVMSWHGDHDERVALTALRQGHDVIMTPQESLYFDHVQSSVPGEWAGPPPAATLHDAYDTIVIPRGTTRDQATHILGVQGSLWTEQMLTFAHDQHAVFPRVAALAELGWSGAASHDWHGFLQRLPAELARYRDLGIGYADSAFAPVFAVSPAASDRYHVAVSNQTAFGSLRYTTDGSAPTPTSTAYAQPLDLRDGTTLRVATFADDGFALAAARTQVLDASTLLTRDDSALATCSHEPPFRLDGASVHGTRPTYALELGHACWLWPKAPLDGVTQVTITAERLAWRDGDEAKNAVVHASRSASGEFDIHADTCTGPVLASVSLDGTAGATGPIRKEGKVAMPAGAGVRDLCIIATGDPRDGVWALARVAFSK